MNALDGLKIGLGVVIVLGTVYDVFKSVVLPRPALGRFRASQTIVRELWVVWRWTAERPRKLQMRESALAAYAPAMVVVLLILWGFALIVGYALIYSGLQDGLTPQPDSFGGALYYSTGRMLAFPVHGIEASGTVLPLVTSIEAASGFGLFALVISLLFSLVTSFQRRETAVVALDALAGAPPSGVQLLENCAKHSMPEQLATTFDTWQAWTADVLESHLSYPLLFYFRSSHDNEAWTNSLGAVMDAATLVLSTIDGGPAGKAHLMFKVGSHFMTDMRRWLGYGEEKNPGVEREEFIEARQRLELVGYRLRDVDASWAQFSALRVQYGPWLNRIARALAVPPAQWMGDRSYLPHRGRSRPSPRS